MQRTTTAEDANNSTTHKLFYKNTMSAGCKQDEKVLKQIMKTNIKTTNPTDKIKLIIYYKSPSTSSTVLRNNMAAENSMLKKSNIVYNCICQLGDCALLANCCLYIGHTTTSLSRIITMHLQQGDLMKHMAASHHLEHLTRQMIVNIEILAEESDPRRLKILEAILIDNVRLALMDRLMPMAFSNYMMFEYVIATSERAHICVVCLQTLLICAYSNRF